MGVHERQCWVRYASELLLGNFLEHHRPHFVLLSFGLYLFFIIILLFFFPSWRNLTFPWMASVLKSMLTHLQIQSP